MARTVSVTASSHSPGVAAKQREQIRASSPDLLGRRFRSEADARLRTPSAERDALADEGEVVVAAGSVGDGGTTVGRDVEGRRVEATATVCSDRASPGVADANGVTGVAAAVDVANRDRAAVGR